MINSDDDRRREFPEEDFPAETEDYELPGEEWEDDLPDDFEDVPEPLADEDEASIGGTTDPRASRNRQDGLRKDGEA